MSASTDDYLRQLQALLPSGAAWAREPGAALTLLLEAWAEELARIDARGDVLIEEADPRTTFELLEDWERVAGLPDPCGGAVLGTQQRQNALAARLVSVGGQTPAYFIDVATKLGYAITITEFRPHDVEQDCEHPLYGDDWAYAWQINAPTVTAGDFSVEDGADDFLAFSGNTPLTCVMNRLKPAHTILLFNFA